MLLFLVTPCLHTCSALKLWAKCKKLCCNKVIHAFWISNGSIKLKVSETGNVHTVSHDVDLEVLFLGNNVVENIQRM